jgi:hypothetical protein
MACCAFAVYLLSQLLLPLRWFRDQIRGDRPVAVNAATAWSPGGATLAFVRSSPSRSADRRPLLAAIVGIEAAALLIAAAAMPVPTSAASGEQNLVAALHAPICSALGRQP